MFKILPTDLFLLLILLTGLLTIVTDLRQKKIYNTHLLIGAGLGFIVAGYALITNTDEIIPHLINSALAFLMGWILYRVNIWRGGDAKLFALYAFLIPPLQPNFHQFPSTLSLFACSYIAGMILLMPVFIKDILSNYAAIYNDLWEKRNSIFEGAMASIFYFWMLFPLYHLAKISSPLILLIIVYLGFIWGYGDPDKETKENHVMNFLRKKRLEICLVFLFGLLMRLWLAPDSLSVPALMHSLLMIGMWITLSIGIHTSLNHLKQYQDRIPFAPLLFIGCLLTYTPFLIWIQNLIRR